MRVVTLAEHDFESVDQLHAFLAVQFSFPAYYGANFAALADCLGDIAQPTRLVIKRDNSVEASWFDKACAVMACVALENECLDIVFEG